MNNLIVNTTEQTPIEIALGIDKKGMTSARRLYEFLELSQKHYSRWIKKNLLENEFAIENEDYFLLPIDGEYSGRGQKATDYKLSASFAKKLAMGTHNQKGEIAKEYFIKVEEKLKQVVMLNNSKYKIPKTHSEALRLAADLQEENEKLKKSPRIPVTSVMGKWRQV